MAALREQIERSQVPILVADNTSRYIAANPPAEQLTGFSTEELLGMRVSDLTPPLNAGDAQHLWEEFIAHGAQRGEFELRPRGSGPVRVRYWAYASVAPGIHVSIVVPTPA